MSDGNEHVDSTDEGNIATNVEVIATGVVSPAEPGAKALAPEPPVVNPNPSDSRRGRGPPIFGPRGGATRELRETARRGHALFGDDPSDQVLALDKGGAEENTLTSDEAETTNVQANSGPQHRTDETLISAHSERDEGPTDGAHAQELESESLAIQHAQAHDETGGPACPEGPGVGQAESNSPSRRRLRRAKVAQVKVAFLHAAEVLRSVTEVAVQALASGELDSSSGSLDSVVRQPDTTKETASQLLLHLRDVSQLYGAEHDAVRRRMGLPAHPEVGTASVPVPAPVPVPVPEGDSVIAAQGDDAASAGLTDGASGAVPGSDERSRVTHDGETHTLGVAGKSSSGGPEADSDAESVDLGGSVRQVGGGIDSHRPLEDSAAVRAFAPAASEQMLRRASTMQQRPATASVQPGGVSRQAWSEDSSDDGVASVDLAAVSPAARKRQLDGAPDSALRLSEAASGARARLLDVGTPPPVPRLAELSSPAMALDFAGVDDAGKRTLRRVVATIVAELPPEWCHNLYGPNAVRDVGARVARFAKALGKGGLAGARNALRAMAFHKEFVKLHDVPMYPVVVDQLLWEHEEYGELAAAMAEQRAEKRAARGADPSVHDRGGAFGVAALYNGFLQFVKLGGLVGIEADRATVRAEVKVGVGADTPKGARSVLHIESMRAYEAATRDPSVSRFVQAYAGGSFVTAAASTRTIDMQRTPPSKLWFEDHDIDGCAVTVACGIATRSKGASQALMKPLHWRGPLVQFGSEPVDLQPMVDASRETHADRGCVFPDFEVAAGTKRVITNAVRWLPSAAPHGRIVASQRAILRGRISKETAARSGGHDHRRMVPAIGAALAFSRPRRERIGYWRSTPEAGVADDDLASLGRAMMASRDHRSTGPLRFNSDRYASGEAFDVDVDRTKFACLEVAAAAWRQWTAEGGEPPEKISDQLRDIAQLAFDKVGPLPAAEVTAGLVADAARLGKKRKRDVSA